MSTVKKKIDTSKGKKTQFEETEQASEPDAYIACIVELPEQVFKIPLINMLRDLIDKVDSMQKQRGEVAS